MSHTGDDLRMLQALPLELKIRRTQQRIREFVDVFGEDGVYVSFSGGKDSTVLLDIARGLYPNMKAVYSNTTNEYPQIVEFVKSFNNVDIVTPESGFAQVIKTCGYPVISKEVSECVYNARRFLDSTVGGGYGQAADRLFGTYSYRRIAKGLASSSILRDEQIAWNLQKGDSRSCNPICGQNGNDTPPHHGRRAKDAAHKYRRLRGIGEYSNQIRENNGMAWERQSNNAGRYL